MKILLLCLSIVIAFDLTNPLIDVCYDEAEHYQNICPLVRTQNRGYCWIYAATNLATIKYRQLTKNELQLSVEQVADLFNEQMTGIDCDKNDEICIRCKEFAFQRIVEHDEGGYGDCALYYMKRFNIIDEYYYPYTNGVPHKYNYRSEKFSNLIVNDVAMVAKKDIDYLVGELYSSVMDRNSMQYKSFASNLLQYLFPIGVNIYVSLSFPQTCVLRDVMISAESNHAVVGVGIYNGTDGELYLKILNSWGVENCRSYFRDIGCTQCEPGYMYLRITNNHVPINNYNWMEGLYIADIDDVRSNDSEMSNIIARSIVGKMYDEYGTFVIIMMALIILSMVHFMSHTCGLIVLFVNEKCRKNKQSRKQYVSSDVVLHPLSAAKQDLYATDIGLQPLNAVKQDLYSTDAS